MANRGSCPASVCPASVKYHYLRSFDDIMKLGRVGYNCPVNTSDHLEREKKEVVSALCHSTICHSLRYRYSNYIQTSYPRSVPIGFPFSTSSISPFCHENWLFCALQHILG